MRKVVRIRGRASGDGARIWGTVGVSDNIIDASWEALRESVEFKLTTAGVGAA